MIDFTKVVDVCYQYCENVSIKTGGNGLVMRCPFCGDSKKSSRTRRFHVDYYSPYQTYVGRCYNGGCEYYDEPTEIITITSKLKNISYTQAKKELVETVYDGKKFKKKMKDEEEVRPQEPKKIEVLDLYDKDILYVDEEPEGRIKQRFHKALLSFMKDRHIPVDCYVAFQGRYKGRIIIPIFIKGKLAYFQGRAIADSTEPKYLNPYVDKEHVIMNIDNFDRDKSIIITEGPIDAWMVNHDQGTTSLQATIPDDLLEILFDQTDKDVIVALDNPLIDKSGYTYMMKLIEKSKYGKKLKYFVMPYPDIKDLNDLVIHKGVKDVYNFILDHTHSYFYIQTKYKLM